jgi:hypothetical protein
VRPATDGEAGEAIEYAKKVLGGESNIVNWSDQGARSEFLNERRRIAETINP